MKKCRNCGFENTDVMNFCLECGNELTNEPQMVVPLDTVDFSNTEKPSERVTENYEKETVVNSRYGFQNQQQQTYSTFQDQPADSSGSNTKLFLAIGGGLVAVVALISLAAAGIVLYSLQKQNSSQPLASKTPVSEKDKDFPSPTPDAEVEDSPDISNDETPQAEETPETEVTPDEDKKTETDEDVITFPTPTTPTKSANYNVKNVSGWQLSEIQTVPRERFIVKVRGRIDLDGIKNNVSAKGVKGHEDRRRLKEYPTGALLMRTHYPDGRHSNIQPVTASQYWENYPDETGKIEFLINDNSPENNSGEFTISFKMQDVPKAKGKK